MDDAGRVDVVRLAEQHPELAQQFRELSSNEAFLDEGFAQDREALERERAEIERLLAAIREAMRPGQRYRVGDEVASGGMGVIYKVSDAQLDRELAMKVIRGAATGSSGSPSTSVKPRQLKRFLNEARITGRLDHPGIVPVHDFGVDSDGRAYFTMKLVHGETLASVVARHLSGEKTWPIQRVLGVLQRVAEALAFAHDRGVVHRDLKPANIMVGAFGEVYVMDWGVARELGRAEDTSPETAAAIAEAQADADAELLNSLTLAGDVVGTPAYMSPEQARGEIERVEARSDVYALGAMLYELLAGHAPHTRLPAQRRTTSRHRSASQADARQVLDALLVGPPPPILDRAAAPELVAIQEKAMGRTIEARYPSALEFAADLQRFLDGRAVHAFETGAWAETKKWVQRNKPLAGALASAVALLIAGLSTTLVFKARADRNASESDLQAGIARTNAETAQRNADEAKREQERAVTAEREAEQKLADVLSLSATRNLERLIDAAKDLVPPTPEMVPRYEAWLAEARELLDGKPADRLTGAPARPSLAEHRAKLAELQARAMPETDPAQLEKARAHYRFAELEAVRAQILWHRRMLGDEPWPDSAEVEAQLAEEKLPRISKNLNALAWEIVDPAAPKYGNEFRALLLAELALENERDEDAAGVKDTLAWAQFRLGRFDEALGTGTQVANEVADGSLDESHTALRAAIAAWNPAAEPDRRADLAQLKARQTALEIAVGERRFANEEDSWWNEQLTGLVSGIEALHDPETGLAGNTLNAAFGWGIAKRYKFARTIYERSIDGPEAQRLWSETIAAIKTSAKYNGLELTPQLGLLPIGMDPDSELWEFAHLQSGDVAERVDGKLVLTESTGIVLVLIPGGPFTMGAQSTDPSGANFDPNAQSNEGPPHAVTLSSYFISKYEMTQGQWLATTGEEPSRYRQSHDAPTLLHPVEQVSWTQCTTNCTNLGLVLPSEAQWENAARAGTSTPWCFGGPNLDSLRGKVNIADKTARDAGADWVAVDEWPDHEDGGVVHRPVGSYPANKFGLHEVHGNLWEWCCDHYSGTAYSGRDGSPDPQGATDGSSTFVIRGGAFNMSARLARSAIRLSFTSELSVDILGVRPARKVMP